MRCGETCAKQTDQLNQGSSERSPESTQQAAAQAHLVQIQAACGVFLMDERLAEANVGPEVDEVVPQRGAALLPVLLLAHALPCGMTSLSLNFEDCETVTDEGLRELAHALPSGLASFSLNSKGCVNITDEGSVELALVSPEA